MNSLIDQYVLDNINPTDPVLEWLEYETNARTAHGRMLSGPTLGRLLTTFVQMLRPHRIMEIGTFTGYSAICLARGLDESGHLDAFEKNDLLEPLIIEGFARAGVSDKISLHFGNALETIPKFNKNIYDIVYIDGNKREYCKYYQAVFDMVRPGGYILTDNVLWNEKVVMEPLPKDAQTQEIVRFNKMIKEDRRVESYILPLRDGLTIIRIL
ncbi:MAG: O-methyltransferase [Bacteroidales bacterium]|nr:O-methyltransferase [Bacteroidales bacterium]